MKYNYKMLLAAINKIVNDEIKTKDTIFIKDDKNELTNNKELLNKKLNSLNLSRCDVIQYDKGIYLKKENYKKLKEAINTTNKKHYEIIINDNNLLYECVFNELLFKLHKIQDIKTDDIIKQLNKYSSSNAQDLSSEKKEIIKKALDDVIYLYDTDKKEALRLLDLNYNDNNPYF